MNAWGNNELVFSCADGQDKDRERKAVIKQCGGIKIQIITLAVYLCSLNNQIQSLAKTKINE